MKYRILYFLFFLPLIVFSQASLEGDWLECTNSKDGNRKFYLLNKPYKDDNREIEDWFSELYPNSENESIKIWLKVEEFNKLLKAEKKKDFKLAYLFAFGSGLRLSEIIG
jgi:integrase